MSQALCQRFYPTLPHFKKKFVYFERKSTCACAHVSGEGAEREREKERENPKQALHCQYRAWHGAESHKQ